MKRTLYIIVLITTVTIKVTINSPERDFYLGIFGGVIMGRILGDEF